MNKRVTGRSKQTELGELPDEWEVVKLIDVVTPEMEQIRSEDVPGDLPYVGLEHIESHTGRLAVANIPPATWAESGIYRFGPQHVLYGRLRPYLNKVLVPTFEGVCSTELIPLACPENRTDRYFLGSYLLSTRFVRYAVRFSQGTRMPRVEFHAFWNAPIPFPPLREQHRIAGVLRLVDELIDRTRQLMEQYQHLRRLALHRLLTRGIGHTRFKQTELGELPEEWEVKALGDSDVSEVLGGGTPSTRNPQFWNGDIPFVTPTDITGAEGLYISATKACITQEAVESSSTRLVPQGTVLLSTRATIGFAVITTKPMAFNQGITAIAPIHAQLDSRLLAYYLMSRKADLERLACGTTYLEVPKRDLRRLPIPLPPLPEQRQIAEHLQKLDALIDTERRYAEALGRLKRAWLDQLLMGKVRVPPEAEEILKEVLPDARR